MKTIFNYNLMRMTAKMLDVTLYVETRGVNWFHFTLGGENARTMEAWLVSNKPAGTVYTFAVKRKGIVTEEEPKPNPYVTTIPRPLVMEYRPKFNNPEGYEFGCAEAEATYHIQRIEEKYIGRAFGYPGDAEYLVNHDINEVNQTIHDNWGVVRAIEYSSVRGSWR